MDWTAVKTEYITTDTSYRRLAKKYGVSATQIGNRSRAEGWIEERERYLTAVVAKSVRKSATIESNRLAKVMTATTKIIDIATKALEDSEQFNRYVVTEGAGDGFSETSEKIFEKTDTKALKDMVNIIKECTGLMRDFYDIPTPAQAEAQRIAAARLELDKQRMTTSNDDDTEYGVFVMPAIDSLKPPDESESEEDG